MWKKLGKEFYIAVACILIGIFLTQWTPEGQSMPLKKDILGFNSLVGEWRGADHEPFEQVILDELRVDDYLNRVYYNQKNEWISFYVGYFRDQVSGQTIHSPRNCMPGSGWNFMDMQDVELNAQSDKYPPLRIKAVRALLINGENRMLTYYWYQSRGRFLTSEYAHKVYLVLDSMRYHRTDGALVRVLAPLPKGADEAEIDARLQDFILRVTPPLQYDYFPDSVG